MYAFVEMSYPQLRGMEYSANKLAKKEITLLNYTQNFQLPLSSIQENNRSL